VSARVEDFPRCSACGGKLFPLVLCDSCGAASILHDADQLDWAAPCPECGTFNPWQLICDQCHSRFPAPGGAAETPVKPLATIKPEAPLATTPLPPPAVVAEGRPKRKLRGEVDPTPVLDTLKAFGLDPSRAQALVDRGYNALWKVARAKEADIGRIPEVGPLAARKIFASLQLLKYSPPQRTREEVAKQEYECPLCGCVTSAFAPSCSECGTAFDEEEMDEQIRGQFASQGEAGLLGFYDGRLADKPEDPDILYARGLFLESLGRIDEAIESLDRARSRAPDARKFKVALLRIQATQARKPELAEKIRSTASSLLDDVFWDQEVAELDDVIARAGPVCDECGRPLPEDADRCPACGAVVGGAAETAPAAPAERPSPELDTLVDDLLVGELEESLSSEELDRTKAAVLDWLIQELEESMRPEEKALPIPEKEPGETGTPTPSPLASSVGFLSGWMRGSRGLVSGVRPKSGARPAAGKVNGLVNGMGRVNGLVNGMGRVNGLVEPSGRVNGLVRGRVNGLAGAQGRINGLVNGTQFVRSGRSSVQLVGPSRRVRYAAIASGTLVAIVIAALLFVPVPGPTSPISIDGSFADWGPVPRFDAATQATNPDISIAQYASLFDRDSLYLFASTQGSTFGDSGGFDGAYFLIDADGNASTGLSFDGIGADSVVEVFGGNHSVAGARLYSFPPGAEVNWSQRSPQGSVLAASSDQGVEAKVSRYDIDPFDPTNFRIMVYMDDFRGESSRSLARLGPEGGAVLLEVSSLTSVLNAGPTALFTIRVRALGIPAATTWVASSIQLNATPGVFVSLSAESVTLTQGQPTPVITASVSAPGFLPGQSVQIDVTGASANDGTSAPLPVFVHGGPVRAYFVSSPSVVRIDGLFADWVGRDVADSDPSPVNDSNVNIIRYGAAVDASTAYFHVAVAGELLEGAVPERIVPSPPGQGGNTSGRPIPLPRQTGEDILRVYIDLNATDTAGTWIGGIYADYLFEIRGEGGRVTSRSLYAWSPGWTSVSLPGVALTKDDVQIEGSLAIGPTTNRTRMAFAATDWSGIGDTTPPVNATVQAPAPLFETPGGVINAPEFHELALPAVATVIVVSFLARRRRRSE